MKNIVEQLTREILQRVISYRRDIHADPELSFCEFNTQTLVCDVLKSEGILFEKVANTGVLARIDGCGISSQEVVVLRADMDALAITEEVDVEFASRNKGIMHACGHDMHTASLLGALIVLNKIKDSFSGTILGLFQPGEEKNPGGASIVIAEGHLDKVTPKIVIGQHVSPELPVGSYGIRAGQFMAATDEIRITIHGKGGHGALPHTTHDPVVAASAVVMALQTVVSRSANPIHSTLLSLGKIESVGGGTNIIPEKVNIEGTLRTMDEDERAHAKNNITNITNMVSMGYGCRADVDISAGFPSVFNNIEAVSVAKLVLSDIVSENNVVEIDKRMTGEDFGFYSRRYPSLFFRTGVGRNDTFDTSNLHSPKFFPSEDSLFYGIVSLTLLAIRFK